MKMHVGDFVMHPMNRTPWHPFGSKSKERTISILLFSMETRGLAHCCDWKFIVREESLHGCFSMLVHSSFTIFKIILHRRTLRLIQVGRIRSTRIERSSKRIHLTSTEKNQLGFITRSFGIATNTTVKYLNTKNRRSFVSSDERRFSIKLLLSYLRRNNLWFLPISDCIRCWTSRSSSKISNESQSCWSMIRWRDYRLVFCHDCIDWRAMTVIDLNQRKDTHTRALFARWRKVEPTCGLDSILLDLQGELIGIIQRGVTCS